MESGNGLPITVGYRPGHQILIHRQLGEHPPALHDLGDAGPHDGRRVPAVYALPVESDRPLGDLPVVEVEQTADRPKCRGLTRSVGTQQGHDLAVTDVE